MRRTLRTLPALALLGGTATAAEIELPPYPFWENDTFVVDEGLIAAQGELSCAEGESDPVQFYLGTLALSSFSQVCDATPEQRAAWLGNLYISGYFGGVWLRDALESTTRGGALPLPMTARTEGGLTDYLVFQGLEAQVGRWVNLAEDGGGARVLLSNRASVPPLLGIYGYNLGYLQVLFENPSPGAQTPPDALSCGSYLLDCASPYYEVEVLERYRHVLGPLQAPTSARWTQMDSLVTEYGESAVAEGRAVWEDILSESTLDPAAYDPLIDLSIKFLLVSDAAALAAMEAWATGDADEGRCATLLQAGLTLWSGSYFMGLASDAPAGTFPSLTCGARSAP